MHVQVCARSSKFSLFDPAKEMAYIQMSRAEKRQGKAAVDLIGSQVCHMICPCPNYATRVCLLLPAEDSPIIFLCGVYCLVKIRQKPGHIPSQISPDMY